MLCQETPLTWRTRLPTVLLRARIELSVYALRCPMGALFYIQLCLCMIKAKLSSSITVHNKLSKNVPST